MKPKNIRGREWTDQLLIAILRDADGTLSSIEDPDGSLRLEAPILLEVNVHPDNTVEIICGKNVYGSLGTLRLTTRISSYPPPKSPSYPPPPPSTRSPSSPPPPSSPPSSRKPKG